MAKNYSRKQPFTGGMSDNEKIANFDEQNQRTSGVGRESGVRIDRSLRPVVFGQATATPLQISYI